MDTIFEERGFLYTDNSTDSYSIAVEKWDFGALSEIEVEMHLTDGSKGVFFRTKKALTVLREAIDRALENADKAEEEIRLEDGKKQKAQSEVSE